MATPQKIWKNKAIVYLRKCGFSFYAIQQAFERKDKRNLIRVWERDKNKYHLPKVGDNKNSLNNQK